MKNIYLLFKWLMLIGFLILLAQWGHLNSHMVTWNLMIENPVGQYKLSTVMASLLFCGFILGMLTSFYIISRLKFSAALKQRKANNTLKNQQKQLQKDNISKLKESNTHVASTE